MIYGGMCCWLSAVVNGCAIPRGDTFKPDTNLQTLICGLRVEVPVMPERIGRWFWRISVGSCMGTVQKLCSEQEELGGA
jgi:hypothetical protein